MKATARTAKRINSATLMSMRIFQISGLLLAAVLGANLPLQSQTVTVDPGQAWLGYVNVSDPPSAGGNYEFGSSWATADLTAVFSGSTLTLGPNQINDPSAYWYIGGGGPGAVGNKVIDANMYVETTGVYVNTTLTFTGEVLANTLAGQTAPNGVSWTTVAFIKDFAPDYSSSTSVTVPLTPGPFSLSLVTGAATHHIQYGFETIGSTVWATDVGPYGNVVINLATVTVPSTPTNVLSNPGFESDPAGENQTLRGWAAYGANTYSETSAAIAHGGVNYLKVYQGTSSSVNYSGVYQDYISGPGATYSADGWAYTPSASRLAGQNAAWIEVTFRDANANILALYRSAIITTNSLANGTFPIGAWRNLPVTNQYNPNNYSITNTVSRLVAPSGTYFVRYQLVFQGDGKMSTGSVYFDDLALAPAGGAPYGDWNITWSDEFNGTSINPNVWTYDLGYLNVNNEKEYYTSSANNSYVSGGLLHVVARQDSTHNYTSARLKSQGLFSCLYGRLEWRAKLPSGTGTWPALWLLGNNITTINWPGCGEIDVMENNGNTPGTVQGSLHSGTDETGYYDFLNGESATSFHTYTLDWSPTAMLWYVDGHLYQSQTSWGSSVGAYPFPFNQPFFFIMNLAIGGDYVGNPSISQINSGTVFPAEMQVDYLRIYQPTTPLKIFITRTNSNLLLTWPGNIVCHLQKQLNSPGTNWVDVTTSTNTLLVTPNQGAAFYRLKSP
jgi:beta-glucanase (GH16 family)